jgi:hypothetical protein
LQLQQLQLGGVALGLVGDDPVEQGGPARSACRAGAWFEILLAGRISENNQMGVIRKMPRRA